MFFGQTVLFRMTSVCGHVLTIDFDARFNNWDKVDPVMYNSSSIFIRHLYFYFNYFHDF